LSILFSIGTQAQPALLEGKVSDLNSNASLAFVSISVKGTSQGTLSDIDGKFSLPLPSADVSVVFSYLGYEPFELLLSAGKNITDLRVKLRPKSVLLKEVKILPGVNPADRVIRRASENRNINNPEKMRSFSYTSYNKMYVTADMFANVDTVRTLDTARMSKAQKLFEKQHMFLSESVSERKYAKPGKNSEKVIASRMSGLKQSPFVLLATQMQSFSFYENLVNVLGKNYLSPLSEGSTKKYLFQLEDTLYSGADTVFIVTYRPKRDKNFEGLKGSLYINTNGYAVQNVIAEPSDNSAILSIKIQQKYEWMEGKQWFPVQLNTDWIYNNIMLTDSATTASSSLVENSTNNKIKAVNRTYVSKIALNPELSRKEFSEVEVVFDKKVDERDEAFWNVYRNDSLTVKDQKTYKVIDSLGKEADLDKKMIWFEALATGKLPCKFIDIDLKTLLNFNEFEGIRAGFGCHTNKKISSVFAIGGYGAYGFRDQDFKYGADASIVLWKRRELTLGASYINDIVESAGTKFYEEDKFTTLNNTESFRKFYISRMDHIEKYESTVSFRALKYLRSELFINHQERYGETGFGMAAGDVTLIKDNFLLNEVGIRFKYTYGEKFTQTLRSKLPLPGNYPVLFLTLSKGLTTKLFDVPGEFVYTRADVRLMKTFIFKSIGKETIQLQAGKVWGNVPYSLLYNNKGSLAPSFNVSIANTFETMGLNEFTSNEYGALFFSHNIGRFMKIRKKFNPELELVHNMGWGRLENPTSIIGLPLRTLEKGFYESGFRIYNVFKISYTSLGMGAMYRYGPYQFSDPIKNIAVKLAITISF